MPPSCEEKNAARGARRRRVGGDEPEDCEFEPQILSAADEAAGAGGTGPKWAAVAAFFFHMGSISTDRVM